MRRFFSQRAYRIKTVLPVLSPEAHASPIPQWAESCNVRAERFVETISKKMTINRYTGYSCIGLDNPKGPENVGSIMRAAGCYDVHSVFYTGERYARASSMRTDTKQVYLQIPLIAVDDLKPIIPLGCVPVAIEIHPDARPLPEYIHPERAFYIFGPEDGSLKSEISAWCEDIVYVPTNGCMNLAATVNVVLYDRLVKLRPRP